MNNGGGLYIESANIGYDYQGTDFIDALGITYEDDGMEDVFNQIIATENTFNNYLYFDYLGGINAHYSIDRIGSTDKSIIFNSEDGYGRISLYEAENYRVAASSVVMGAIANGDNMNIKPFLFAEIFDYILPEQITVIDEELSVNTSAKIYPNPFDHSTNIQYQLIQDEHISIKIFNTNGELIDILVDQKQQKGTHIIEWKPNSLFVGIYFCHIQTGENVQIQKLIILD